MGYNKRRIGNCYEDMAVAFLQQEGYKIIKRNYYGRHGEIDIIALDGDYLVFLEVKYRFSNHIGSPEEAVTYYKQANIISTAKEYIYKNGIPEDMPVRFDVVSILDRKIKVIKNAFEA